MSKSPEFWQNIIYRQYRLPDDYSINELTLELATYLASPNPELRDEYAYMILANWILKGMYENHQLRALVDQMLSNLKRGRGEQGTDSVFLRSFSVLILATLIERDNQVPFLKVDEVRRVLNEVLDYLTNEADVRGYVPGRGWAHSVAHTADALLYLANSQHIGGQGLQDILMTIGAKLTDPGSSVYHHDEDERLALATVAVMDRNLIDQTFYQQWLHTMGDAINGARYDIERNALVQNTRNYLRSLYFQLMLTPKPTQTIRQLRMAVLTTIQQTHRYIR